MIIKWLLTIAFLFYSYSAFCQKRNVTFSILAFYDTIASEKTAWVSLRLTNTSDTTIILSSYFDRSYELVVYLNDNDTLNTNPKYAKIDMDPMTAEIFTKIKPGESREFKSSLFGVLREKSQIKIKFFFPLGDLNKTFNDPETNWINQYFNIDYKAYSKKVDEEYKKFLKKTSDH